MCPAIERRDLCRHLIVQQSVIYYLLIWIRVQGEFMAQRRRLLLSLMFEGINGETANKATLSTLNNIISLHNMQNRSNRYTQKGAAEAL